MTAPCREPEFQLWRRYLDETKNCGTYREAHSLEKVAPQPTGDSNLQGSTMAQYSKRMRSEIRAMIKARCDQIKAHYESVWAKQCTEAKWGRGPVTDLPWDFRVLVFPANKGRRMWTYATCCMSQASDPAPVELHLFSPIPSEWHVELLTIVAHYHRTGNWLGLGHSVNFGRPWLPDSTCQYGLVSLPYLDGPVLENFLPQPGLGPIKFFWLVPITKKERDYKKQHGLESLEARFEAVQFNYLDPNRDSVA